MRKKGKHIRFRILLNQRKAFELGTSIEICNTAIYKPAMKVLRPEGLCLRVQWTFNIVYSTPAINATKISLNFISIRTLLDTSGKFVVLQILSC